MKLEDERTGEESEADARAEPSRGRAAILSFWARENVQLWRVKVSGLVKQCHTYPCHFSLPFYIHYTRRERLVQKLHFALLAIMELLSTFSLPLSTKGPLAGYGCEEREMSLSSTTSAFVAGIDQRDTFHGQPCCIICGISIPKVLSYCHIIRDSEPDVVS